MMFRFLIVFTFLFSLYSCTKNNEAVYVPKEQKSPYNLYKEGIEAFEKNVDPSAELIKQFNFHSTLLENVSNNSELQCL